MDKLEAIIDNKTNGNISDFDAQVKKLSKIELLGLVETWVLRAGEDYVYVINSLMNSLERSK